MPTRSPNSSRSFPPSNKARGGTPWPHKHVSDLLAPVAITREQRAALRKMFAKHGPSFAKIYNDYERATTRDDMFKQGVDKC